MTVIFGKYKYRFGRHVSTYKNGRHCKENSASLLELTEIGKKRFSIARKSIFIRKNKNFLRNEVSGLPIFRFILVISFFILKSIYYLSIVHLRSSNRKFCKPNIDAIFTMLVGYDFMDIGKNYSLTFIFL